MPSRRAEIGPAELKEAREVAGTREFTNANPFIIADTVERGLSLRVQGAAASWLLKFNGRTKSLGSIAEIRTATTAREVAARVRAIMRDGGNVDSYLTSRRAGADHEKANSKVDADAARAAGKWTWSVLVAQYCDEYLGKPRMTRRGIRESSPESVAESRRYLSIPECAHLTHRLLSELSVGDLEQVRDTCAAAGRKAETVFTRVAPARRVRPLGAGASSF